MASSKWDLAEGAGGTRTLTYSRAVFIFRRGTEIVLRACRVQHLHKIENFEQNRTGSSCVNLD